MVSAIFLGLWYSVLPHFHPLKPLDMIHVEKHYNNINELSKTCKSTHKKLQCKPACNNCSCAYDYAQMQYKIPNLHHSSDVVCRTEEEAGIQKLADGFCCSIKMLILYIWNRVPMWTGHIIETLCSRTVHLSIAHAPQSTSYVNTRRPLYHLGHPTAPTLTLSP